ncbi:hypothetical protein BOTNAR_0131g00010 [Botryotinia narcissicola]|uniref:DUF7770 domain-containing protein n=1 Tax=Botryotinia narcissicola TaxID=278944 RepID=A0A4Z1IL77_9HELO|nr:hypothetical protein BOTNAR_0131g00010 [Botryotinia narcissicola]
MNVMQNVFIQKLPELVVSSKVQADKQNELLAPSSKPLLLMSSRKHVKPSSSRTKPKDSRSSTRAVEKSDYNLVVKAIRVTIHTTGKFFESDIRSGNHASIFLLTSNDASVRLNMTKTSADATMGTYKIRYCSYQRTSSSLRDFDFTATSQGLTVGHVLKLIEQKKRNKYQLALSGLGCRHWVFLEVNFRI